MRELLTSHSLPTEDFESSAIEWLVAVDESGAIRGMAGLEVHEGVGLLRSLVAARRGEGIGSALVAEVERSAESRKVANLYLLTQTAEVFFARRGYSRVDRSEAPQALQRTTEFASLCPASAACMRKTL